MSLAQAMVLPLEGSVRTFGEDEELPSLPLPSLAQSLQKYLDSVRPFVSPEQFSKTEEIVQKFEKGIGRKLHEKLKVKAAQSRNWVEKWWEDKAYLENRTPLFPFCSMSGVAPMEDIWTFQPGCMVKYASLHMYYVMKMWQLLRKELLIPTMSADGKTVFSMSQFRRLYNCSRIAFPKKDIMDIQFKTEKEGFCPSHVIVMCNGSIYVVDTFESESGSALTPPEWEKQLQHIVNETRKHRGPGIGRLTCDDRDTWAKNRGRLVMVSGENARNLHLIDSAVCILTLDPEVEPHSGSEVLAQCLGGNYDNLWADKSLGLIYFGNGCSGGVADHTAFDGTISIASTYFTFYSLLENNGEWNGSNATRSLPPPTELTFVLDSKLNEELNEASIRQNAFKTMVVIINEIFLDFGKAFPVKHRVHPDTFVQIALQLAYFRMHKRPAPCYETATTRAYYNGRTETLRSCNMDTVEWMQAMMNDAVQVLEKASLMRKAGRKHDILMKEARENAGCDRHLFGLYCIAEENGIPIPDLYQDSSYTLSGGGGNFILSTSLLGYTPIGGGVAPMCTNGYGVFYNMCSDRFYFTISVMRDSKETSAPKFYSSLCSSLKEMQKVLEAEQQYNSTQAHL